MDADHFHGWDSLLFVGPDVSAHFWLDKRFTPDAFSKRAQRRRGTMIWGSISWEGKTELVIVNGKLDADLYENMIEDLYSKSDYFHAQRCLAVLSEYRDRNSY